MKVLLFLYVLFCVGSLQSMESSFLSQMSSIQMILSLRFAALNGDLRQVKYLVTQGADVNCTDSTGVTPLMAAAQDGHYLVVKYLVSEGAKLNECMNGGNTALLLAVQNGRLEVFKFLKCNDALVNVRNNDGQSILLLAAMYGHLSLVKHIIESVPDFKRTSYDDIVVLMTTIKSGKLNVVKYLLAKVVKNVEIMDKGSWTPLMMAAKNGQLAVVKYLISIGAIIDKEEENGFTALRGAIQEGHLKVVRYLVLKGADIQKKTIDGSSMLMRSVQIDDIAAVKYLLELGTNLNQVMVKNKLTALMVAALCGRTTVYRLLKEKGADSTLRDDKGRTALDLARSVGNDAILQVDKRLTEAANLQEDFCLIDDGRLLIKKSGSKKKHRKKKKKNKKVTLTTAKFVQQGPLASSSTAVKSGHQAPSFTLKIPKCVDYSSVISTYKRGSDGSFIEFENEMLIRINDSKNHQKIQLFKDEITGSVFENMWKLQSDRLTHTRVKRWFNDPKHAVEDSKYDHLRSNRSDLEIIENHNFAQAVDQFVATFGKKGYSSQNKEYMFFVGQLQKDGHKQVVQFEYAYTSKNMLYHRLMRKIDNK